MEEFSHGPDADNSKKTKKAGKEKHEVKHSKYKDTRIPK